MTHLQSMLRKPDVARSVQSRHASSWVSGFWSCPSPPLSNSTIPGDCVGVAFSFCFPFPLLVLPGVLVVDIALIVYLFCFPVNACLVFHSVSVPTTRSTTRCFFVVRKVATVRLATYFGRSYRWGEMHHGHCHMYSTRVRTSTRVSETWTTCP